MDEDKKQSRTGIWKMFDEISSTYDFLNHFLSFGIDIYWRKKVVNFLPKTPDIRLLDLATGTADQLITILKKAKHVKNALGIDLSKEMIRIGQKKIIDKPYSHQVTLMEGDATSISLNDESVDCVTMSFGIRNVTNIAQCLNECFRVLAPNGRAIILEFSIPKNPIIKFFHLLYLRSILPLIGGLISRKADAYKYLNKTVETFIYGKQFCNQMKKSGFYRVKAYPLTFGVVTLYVGEKLTCPTEI